MAQQKFYFNFDFRQAFVKQSTKFSGRPRIEFFDEVTEGMGLAVVDYGELWMSQRMFGHVALRE